MLLDDSQPLLPLELGWTQLLLPGPWAGDSGSATRSCVAVEGAQRPNRPLACQARPAALPWRRC